MAITWDFCSASHINMRPPPIPPVPVPGVLEFVRAEWFCCLLSFCVIKVCVSVVVGIVPYSEFRRSFWSFSTWYAVFGIHDQYSGWRLVCGSVCTSPGLVMQHALRVNLEPPSSQPALPLPLPFLLTLLCSVLPFREHVLVYAQSFVSYCAQFPWAVCVGTVECR